MKLSNFEMKGTAGSGLDKTFYAYVDVTTGFLWWKITRRVEIFKKYPAICWRFLDTGKWTPGCQAENLEEVWEAKSRKSWKVEPK